MSMTMVASALLLIASAPAAVGFVLQGVGVVPALALRGVGPGDLSLHGRSPARRRGAATRMMADKEDEWFNPGAVAKLARSAPVTARRTPTPVAPAPVLLEGVLDWGYYAGMSWEGRGKGTQVGGINNQDSIIASSLDNSILFGVFDGHGEYGREASSAIVDNLPTNVYEVEALVEAGGMDAAKVQEAMEAAFAKTHTQLLEQQNFDTFLSGSTAITVLVAGPAGQRRLVVANAGDCRAILASAGWGGKSVTTQLSVDQTPDRPDERRRIEGLGGIVGMVNGKLAPMAVMSPEEVATLGEDLGPVRVFWPDGSFEPPYESCFPGLAMSRSLGDSCLDDIGVQPVPEVTVRALKPKDRFMVIASDGVWQVMSNEDVAQTVTQAGGDATKACQDIFARAAERWETNEGPSYRDDISCFVVYFAEPGSGAGAGTTTIARAD